jgi:hypothetical protein
MTKRFAVLYAIVIGPLVVGGCGGADDDETHTGETLSIDTGNWVTPYEEIVNPYDDTYEESEFDKTGPLEDLQRSSDSEESFEICESVTASLKQVATRVMILLDRSESMNDDDKWELAGSAIDSMVTEFDKKIAFGLDVFSVNGESSRRYSRDSAMCDVGDSAVLDVAMDNGSAILEALSSFRPGNATPLLLAMMNYRDVDYAPQFMDSKGNSYLVIISDGMDTCGDNGQFDREGGASAAQLSEVASQLNEDSGIKTIVIGFGEGADPDQLDAIARAGGTQFTEHFDASDGDELTEALGSIAEAVVVSCRFEIGEVDKSELNLDLVNVFFDDEAIPRDVDCSRNTGWTWTDSNRTTIEFCQEACNQIKANEVDNFQLEIACSADDLIII